VSSVQNQRFQNYEIVIVDDVSMDGSFSVLQDLANQDSRIQLYQNEKITEPKLL
jgi:glycosyltransferase involved in cell wall biosynthesis